MKINTKLWTVVIIISLIIIGLKEINLVEEKKYIPSRTYTESNKLQLETLPTLFDSLHSFDYLRLYKNNIYAISQLNNTVSIAEYDLNLNKRIQSYSFEDSSKSNIDYIHNEEIVYSNKYMIYKKMQQNENISEIKLKNFSVFKVIPTDSTCLLLFGVNEEQNSKQKFGFFLKDKNDNLILIKELSKGTSNNLADFFLKYCVVLK